MTFFKKTFLSLIFTLLFLANFSVIYAQENEATDPVVYDKESFSRDIRQLKLQYRGELEEYRSLENLYLIAKSQYHKLGTLASLEDAVQKTQEVMILRDRVLRTYLRLLRLKLLSQPGIELPEKTAAEQSLLSAIKNVEQHQQEFSKSLDKVQINEISEGFEVLIDQVEEAAYQALTLMSIGELQTIHDKAIVLRADMEVEIASAGGALKSTERKRSFDETNRLLESLKSKFDLIEEKYANPSSSGYKGIHQAIQKQLNSIHSSLSQALTFLGELLKI
ncbi:MAG: hypothetical protein HN846_00240 [Candidatus Pacebacteria bacterium]|jgi:hypothetical protein|nr:hypothetical protein [Candidatus Paceibacterota bacterium]MBT3511637.1 hypothetical protein [Candidatus Paceibacterota bacterium]MBT4004600.1 hypothetical protein [Candidatus Paceibacterota bacterium]MBT4358899.1 hypothetical protein [Candidatus Paceibacterota bacterium]MBT4681243.1 hypothetical protein [Candidatus Paceibacterota bacterium]